MPNSSLPYTVQIAKICRRYPKAYNPWTLADESFSSWSFQQGESIGSLSSRLQRQPSAILSRLRKVVTSGKITKDISASFLLLFSRPTMKYAKTFRIYINLSGWILRLNGTLLNPFQGFRICYLLLFQLIYGLQNKNLIIP